MSQQEKQILTRSSKVTKLLIEHCCDVVKNVAYLTVARSDRGKGIKVIFFTAETVNKLTKFSDVLIIVLSAIKMHIQKCHIAVGPKITTRVETILSKK